MHTFDRSYIFIHVGACQLGVMLGMHGGGSGTWAAVLRGCVRRLKSVCVPLFVVVWSASKEKLRFFFIGLIHRAGNRSPEEAVIKCHALF